MTQSQRSDFFEKRHIGPNAKETQAMLEVCKAASLDTLIDETIPPHIRSSQALELSEAVGEFEYLEKLQKIASKNKVYKSYIGLGYYDCIVPAVILRNIFENPGWYTQYTPYQAEISQGRLEALLNFQTMVMELTGMEIANASLLDEGTAVAEAMGMAHRIKNRRKKEELRNKFFVANGCYETTLTILQTRAQPLGIEIVQGDFQDFTPDSQFFGAFVQYPEQEGKVYDYRQFVEVAHASDLLVIFAADLLSLSLLTPPRELGADVVVGSSQRFGVPLGFGGPHAAYLATKLEHSREIPGRVIGVSVDVHGNPAYRMSLQTREQHIKRDRATSNICTAQALLAIMAGMYGVYHGPEGLKAIATSVHQKAAFLSAELKKLGYQQVNDYFFDTLKIQFDDNAPLSLDQVQAKALSYEVNFREIDSQTLGISLDETVSIEDLENLLSIFGSRHVDMSSLEEQALVLPQTLIRTSSFMTHPVFHQYRSETKMMRYLKRLENKDLSLTTSMIPLGSCTMKLNASVQMLPVVWPEFSRIHPFAPADQTQGYAEIIKALEDDLAEITGFAGTSLQPNSGAQGEYSGLLMIRAYHLDRGDTQRNIILIPSSAHGTNPASATMCGMKVAVVRCDEMGNIDVGDLEAKAEKYHNELAGLMITYPSTHGVYEEQIIEVCKIVHDHGGQIYMDGANMNAQVDMTSPGLIGADVCHLNLHKTFAIPHGGGGPGMGPICVAKHLVPYLPKHPLVETGGEKGITAISSAPWGSASILLISYAYIKMLGQPGLNASTKYAILNANYIKERLCDHYPLLYEGKNGRVAHEMIFDMRGFRKTAKIEAADIAKRLMDYGFHAPTVSFPVVGTLMIEPTESEDKDELDRFCDAMIAIRQEIQEIEEGVADTMDNVLKNAPHTAMAVMEDDWTHPYSRQKAAFPLPYLKSSKFWPSVGRINESHGDRNLICSCPTMESYED